MIHTVVGWTDTYTSKLPTTPFSAPRKQALVERIRKRGYDFNFNDYQFLSYCCPAYEDGKICILNKCQFDDVMNEAWKDMHRTQRLLPIDIINDEPIDGILFEKNKFKEQFMESENNE
jgi:hypothetical protein